MFWINSLRGFLAIAILSAFGLIQATTPVFAQDFKVTYRTPMLDMDVPALGSGTAKFTILDPDFTGDIIISGENTFLDFEPKTVSVVEGENQEVQVTFQGDEALGSVYFIGTIVLTPISNEMIIAGYRIPILIKNKVDGIDLEPLAIYSLSLFIEPEGSGSVILQPSEGPFTGQYGRYVSGQKVELTTSPAEGYAFDHWSGDLSGYLVEAQITMNSDKTVTAHFTPTGKGGIALWLYILIGVLGGVVVMLLIWWLLRRRKKSRQ